MVGADRGDGPPRRAGAGARPIARANAKRRSRSRWRWRCRPTTAWTRWSKRPPSSVRRRSCRCSPNARCCAWPASAPRAGRRIGRRSPWPPASNAGATACRLIHPVQALAAWLAGLPPGAAGERALAARLARSRALGDRPQRHARPLYVAQRPGRRLLRRRRGHCARLRGFVSRVAGSARAARRHRAAGGAGGDRAARGVRARLWRNAALAADAAASRIAALHRPPRRYSWVCSIQCSAACSAAASAAARRRRRRA